jgi:PKHD-type hydroxylase
MEKVHQWSNIVNQEIVITKIQFDANKIIQKGEQQILDVANQKHKDGNTYRNSKVTWIKEWPELIDSISIAISDFRNTWDFDCTSLEPLQYSNYNEGDYYDWHNDQHESAYPDGLVRKLSFTIFLNDDYEGGEFEICKLSGSKKLPKINVTNINQKIITDEDRLQPSIGTIIIFPSYVWHRVAPVTKGIRKSLVGWILGKPFR